MFPVIDPYQLLADQNPTNPTYTTGSVQVYDAPAGTALGIIGIATGPSNPVVGGAVPEQTSYSAGQTVQVATYGVAFCQFDTQVLPGDYVVPSQYNPGYCASIGRNYPTPGTYSYSLSTTLYGPDGGEHQYTYGGGQVLGIALAANDLGMLGWQGAVPVLLSGGGTVR
jgi:hypothetical protein